MSLEEDARTISDTIAKENESMTEPITEEFPVSPNPDIPNLDVPVADHTAPVQNQESLDIHYSVRRPRDAYAASPITNLTDASTFAKVLAELTNDVWNVLETRTTVTNVASFGSAN